MYVSGSVDQPLELQHRDRNGSPIRNCQSDQLEKLSTDELVQQGLLNSELSILHYVEVAVWSANNSVSINLIRLLKNADRFNGAETV